MRIAYFDCFSGAAGDMILGALLDAGLDAGAFREALGRLGLTGYELSIDRVTKQGFAATRVDIRLDDGHPQPHRHLSDVRKIIDAGKLPDAVKARAVAVFERLAAAEAEVHGSDIEKIHFHEVGAVDAILDIVGACWGLDRLGIDRVVCSPLPPGSGTVRCAHGLLPVPAPATALLLRGVPLAASRETGELVTPTGAAILTEWADGYGPVPEMRIERIGMGAGHRDGGETPNVLRVLLGDSAESPDSDRVVVLQANLDDATPEIIGHALQRLMDAGALDAYCVPIQMKKSRPGVMLTVLAGIQQAAALEDLVFAETTTFGVRRYEATRSKLARRIETVDTPFGEMRVKVGSRGDKILTVAPEFDDCRQAALRHGVALRRVMAAAIEAFNRRDESHE